MTKPIVVMTGATSGLGACACEGMLAAGARVVAGARGSTPSASCAEWLPVDLARLQDVRAFAAAAIERVSPPGIDALVLNAGMTSPRDADRTAEGFERTFAVNHLAHYLLLRLLLPHLREGARVILTTSGTHDPERRTRIPPPHHADARLLAFPENDPALDPEPHTAGGRAYAASKLCNVLTVRAFAASDEARGRRLRVVAYDPGPTPGTGLARDASLPLRILWSMLDSPLRVLMPDFNSRERAGAALADLALGRIVPPNGATHASLRRGVLTWPEPSVLARRADVAEALWRQSAELVGLAE